MLDRSSTLSFLMSQNISHLPWAPVMKHRQQELARHQTILWQVLFRIHPRLVGLAPFMGTVLLVAGCATMLGYLGRIPAGEVTLFQGAVFLAGVIATIVCSIYVATANSQQLVWQFTRFDAYPHPVPPEVMELAQKIREAGPLHQMYVEHIGKDPFFCIGGPFEDGSPRDVRYLKGWDAKGNILQFA